MLNLIEKYKIVMLEPDDETTRLADLYVREGIIPVKYRFDSMHIACASVNGLDGVLLFNFQHINKIRTKEMTTLVNLRKTTRVLLFVRRWRCWIIKNPNTIEKDLNEIRLSLYEETKHMSPSELTAYIKAQPEPMLKKHDITPSYH